MTDLAKIEEIYHAALEKAPSEREDFLRESCGGDENLRREVESLLSFDEQAAEFIEMPPGGLAADFIVKHKEKSGLIGRTFGHYRILSQIGAGGMGEVYLAEDTKLGRKAALKILPAKFSADAERQKRFEREARAVSALNHPNIITIYGIEESENLNFIATEFIEGQTLREKIAEKPLSANETVEIAAQITSALESAHSVGIIHRDIKPANIMIRRDGIVKVLDFGLAKLTAKTASGESETQYQTGPNRVMGTINYMSPEQALGEKVDNRTDIFSFGAVLYEMLSGRSPFAGDSEGAIYNATINTNPPSLSESNPEIPPALDAIIKRAIAKKCENRYQTVSDLRLDLQKLKQSSDSPNAGLSAVSPVEKPKTDFWKILAFSVVLLLVTAVAYFAFFNRQSETNLPDVAQNFSFSQLTSNGDASLPSLSPDGKTIVFSSRAEGNWDVYFQRVGGANAINLTKNSAADDFQAAYSPVKSGNRFSRLCESGYGKPRRSSRNR